MMPNSDPIRIGEKTWGTGSTLIAQFSSAPPSDWDASTFVDWRPFPGSAMLIGWNGNSSGDGILGGAAPGGIGVWGVVGSGETTPVPGDCGVYGTAISTGVSGFASGDVTGSGTGVAGMGKVGVHGHGLNVGSASDFGVVGFSEAGTGVAGSSTSGIGISASSKTNIGLVAGNHETEILWMREMIGQAYVPTFRSVLTPQGRLKP